jgi:hypothetical protein
MIFEKHGADTRKLTSAEEGTEDLIVWGVTNSPYHFPCRQPITEGKFTIDWDARVTMDESNCANRRRSCSLEAILRIVASVGGGKG